MIKSGYDIDRVRDTFLSVESHLGLSRPRSDVSLIDLGDWLLVPSELFPPPIGRYRRDIMPIMAGRLYARAVRRLLERKLLRLPTHAQVVNIRSHWRRTGLMRSFYRHFPGHAGAISVKTAVDSDSLGGEARIREVVEKIGILPVPKMHAFGKVGTSSFVVEDWIEGRTVGPGDFARIRDDFFPSMTRHYSDYGIRRKSIEEVWGSDFFPEILRALTAVDWSRDWLPKGHWMETLSELQRVTRTMPCSFCHGDLNFGHIAMDPIRGPVILDWGASSVKPIAVDFSDLISSSPLGWDRVYEVAGTHLARLSDSESFTPAAQLWIASLRKLGRWSERSSFIAKEDRQSATEAALRREVSLADRFLRALSR